MLQAKCFYIIPKQFEVAELKSTSDFQTAFKYMTYPEE